MLTCFVQYLPWSPAQGSWDDLREQYPDQDEKYLSNYGFNAAYIVTLLTDGYGFPMQSRHITTTGRLQGAELGWTLGAMVKNIVDLEVRAATR